jgi:uncharacterized membrane protein YozB (DUF420 family)
MPSGATIILSLKVAVVAVTVLLLVSLEVLRRGNVRLHGRINIVFFILTMTAVLVFEGLIRFGPSIETGWNAKLGWEPHHEVALTAHLCFVIPLMGVLPAMLYTGLKRKRRAHVALAWLFSILWVGMFVTGVCFLPHDLP